MIFQHGIFYGLYMFSQIVDPVVVFYYITIFFID